MQDQNNSTSIGIIGSGLGGLATACRLAFAGYKVIVYEKNSTFGGKAGSFELTFEDKGVNGRARFDSGPSLMTMPFVYHQLFKDCGQNLDDYLEYQRLDENCRYFWPKDFEPNVEAKLKQEQESKLKTERKTERKLERKLGPDLILGGSIHSQIEALHQVFGTDKKILQRYFEGCKKLFELTSPVYLETQFGIKSLFSPSFWQAFAYLGLMSPLTTLHNYHQKIFKASNNTNRLVQVFDRYATFNGSDPYQTPATIRAISWVENGLGIYLPTSGKVGEKNNGIRAIPTALYNLAIKLRVVFAFDTKVDRVIENSGKTLGVEIEGRLYQHSAVVCNMDWAVAQTKLLGRKSTIPSEKLAKKHSTSAILFYWVVKTQTDLVELHNTFFSDDYKTEFEQTNSGKVPTDPTIYLNVGCKQEEGMVTSGYQNWFVVINTPIDTENDGRDWQNEAQNLRKVVIKRLTVQLGFDVQSSIVAEKIKTPPDLHKDTFGYGGSLYGQNSNGLFGAFLRPRLVDKKLKGLFYVGGTVHPGGGMPLAVLSGQMVSKGILKYMK